MTTSKDFSGEEVVWTDRFVFFWKPPATFGQWTPSPFTVDGEHYVCAEQYMMAEKARLFGDEDVRRRILQSPSPRQHKKLGREVKGFDPATWEAHRLDIVVRGNLAKFTQHPEMRAELLSTGDRILVEASPLDQIWGIGLRADHPDAQHPDQWVGLNLLGEALMKVRAQLRAAADG